MTEPLPWPALLSRLRRRAGWIALTTAVALAGVVAPRVVTRERFAAEALLAVAPPDEAIEIAPRLRLSQAAPVFPYRAGSPRTFPELATTDAALDAVRREVSRDMPHLATPDDVRDRVRVRALADGTLITVRARGRTPDGAARLANTVADVFAGRVEAVYAPGGELEALVAARDEAAVALAERAARLADHRAAPERAATEIEADRLAERYAARLAARDRQADVVREAEALRARVADGGVPDAADRAIVLALRRRALAVEGAPPGDGAVSVDAAGVDASVEAIDDLVASTAAGLARSEAELEGIVADLGARRTRLAESGLAAAALEREHALAVERWQTLARRVDELDAARRTRPLIRIASPAVPPDGPDLDGLLRDAAAALVLGLVAGALLALFVPAAGDRDAGAPGAARGEPAP